MATKNELLQQAEIIRTQQEENGNTADLVGSLLKLIINYTADADDAEVTARNAAIATAIEEALAQVIPSESVIGNTLAMTATASGITFSYRAETKAGATITRSFSVPVLTNSLAGIMTPAQMAELTASIQQATTSLLSEITARTAADNALGGMIDSEAQTRSNEDAALRTSINTEAQTREAQDALLAQEIERIGGRLETEMAGVNESIAAATASESGDGAFDISKATASGGSSGVYENLAAAIVNVPVGVRKGGMSVKYIENVYADYGVVVTEGLETQPTGTALQSAPSITDGVYKASQLSVFAPLPSTIGASNTYYIAVTVDETTTYTKWVVTKETNDSTKYVQWMLMSSEWSSDINNWLSFDVINGLEKEAGETKFITIPFDGGNNYIKKASTKGDIASHGSWRSTKLIPVKEGDVFYYTGISGTVALGAAGYELNGETYTYKITLVLSTGTSAVENVYIVIPKGVTHIMACCTAASLSSSSLMKVEKSALGKLEEGLGDVENIKIISLSEYTTGHYVNNNGQWMDSNSLKYLFIDVTVGDTVELYQVKGFANTCTFVKKLTDTTFTPLATYDNSEHEKVAYNVKEDMTLCISVAALDDTPRMTIIRKTLGETISTLVTEQSSLNAKVESNIEWNDIYDLELGMMFNSIAVIGDSMSVGSISTVETAAPNSKMNASWLSILAKRWGCNSRKHYAIGGSSCYSWLNSNDAWGLGALLRDTDDTEGHDPLIFNCYFIAHGHNDGGSNYSGVGNATDTAAEVRVTEGVPSCDPGNTFCAYYKAVINQIRTKAPHAMIFCLSEYDSIVMNKSDGAYRQAIIDIAEWYYEEQDDHLIYHLETGGVPDAMMVLGSHYSTIGYFHIAKRVDQEVNKVIYEHRNVSEVKEFGSYNNVNGRYSEHSITITT